MSPVISWLPAAAAAAAKPAVATAARREVTFEGQLAEAAVQVKPIKAAKGQATEQVVPEAAQGEAESESTETLGKEAEKPAVPAEWRSRIPCVSVPADF